MLKDGEIIEHLEDGVIVQDGESFAHIHRDGYVEFLYTEQPNCFAEEIHRQRESAQAQEGSQAASSSGQECSFEDWLNHQKNHHKGNVQAQQRRSVASSCGGGDPDPRDPNRKRHWQNKNRDNSSEHPYGKYVGASYHNKHRGNSVKSKAPIDGQKDLNLSVSIGENTARRVSICDGEFVILDQTRIGEYHGHVRSFGQLSDAMKTALQDAGKVNHRGKILCK